MHHQQWFLTAVLACGPFLPQNSFEECILHHLDIALFRGPFVQGLIDWEIISSRRSCRLALTVTTFGSNGWTQHTTVSQLACLMAWDSLTHSIEVANGNRRVKKTCPAGHWRSRMEVHLQMTVADSAASPEVQHGSRSLLMIGNPEGYILFHFRLLGRLDPVAAFLPVFTLRCPFVLLFRVRTCPSSSFGLIDCLRRLVR